MRRDVFQAIADPHRRAILDLLSHQSQSINKVADHFSISRPAISKHIKVLTECGLISIRPVGRERYCDARLSKLNEVSCWVDQYKQFWNRKLDALEVYLQNIQSNKQAGPKPTSSKRKKK